MNALEKIGFWWTLKNKVRKWYTDMLGIKESTVEWLYLSAESRLDKLEICGFGECKEANAMQQKFKVNMKISDLPDAYNAVKGLIKKEGYSDEFINNMLKVSCIINYKENNTLFDDTRPCNKMFGSSDKINKKETVKCTMYYYQRIMLDGKEVEGQKKVVKTIINI